MLMLTNAADAVVGILVDCAQADHIPRGERPSKPIDADTGAPSAWQFDAAQLLSQQAKGDREALRILLAARQDLTTTATGQGTRLRALLLSEDSSQLQAIVDDLAPGLTEQRGIGPISAAQAIVNLPHSLTVPKQRQPPVMEVTGSWRQHRPELSKTR